jgi:hypothetical protein
MSYYTCSKCGTTKGFDRSKRWLLPIVVHGCAHCPKPPRIFVPREDPVSILQWVAQRVLADYPTAEETAYFSK